MKSLKSDIYLIFKAKVANTDKWTNRGWVEEWAMKQGYQPNSTNPHFLKAIATQ